MKNSFYNTLNRNGFDLFMGSSPLLMADFYKISHRKLYPEGTEEIYSVFTPRNGKYAPYTDEVVVFGIQFFIEHYLIDSFNKNFFDLPKDVATSVYHRLISNTPDVQAVDISHVEALHDLGYLPLEIRSIKEGTRVPFGTPVLSIRNTKKEFFWLTNFLETLLSCSLWGTMTSATLAYHFRLKLNKYALETTGTTAGVEYQGHDFSMRGMSSYETSLLSSAGHLLSFVGTDTMSAISFLEYFYGADIEKNLVGTSIPATEHSVMSAGTSPDGDRDEYETFKRIITKDFPSGFVSIVSDTYDFWKVCTETLPRLKKEILARDGRVVIRPDSSDPVLMLCGSGKLGETTPEGKGLIEVLWDIFGGTVSEQGYKILNPKVGAIYGDSITLDRSDEICSRLKEKGFASTNVVFGIGSFSYQYVTRDTLGFAMKATASIKNGIPSALFKDPKTDSKKRSHRGRVYVKEENGVISWEDGFLNDADIPEDTLLTPTFLNGKIVKEFSLDEIREQLFNPTF